MSDPAIIEYAADDDLRLLSQADPHTRAMEQKIARREVLIARLEGSAVGWLRFNYFWDAIPFMNMLFVLEAHRGRGVGAQLVSFWEAEMRNRGHHQLLTSTQADETAQHFYRRLGYKDIGRFRLPSEPSDELLLHKTLG
jgi:GNAT superfamily N-acetyltransferase